LIVNRRSIKGKETRVCPKTLLSNDRELQHS
jgi:hypothetical protein